MNDEAPVNSAWNDAVFTVLHEEFLGNDSTCLFAVEGVPTRSGAEELRDEFGEARVRLAPVTPASLVGMGAGAARAGVRVIVELPSHLSLTQSIGHLADHVCSAQMFSNGRVSMPLVLRAVVHENEMVDVQSIASLPGVHIVSPSSASDAAGLVGSALRTNCPVVVLESAILIDNAKEIDDKEFACPLETAGVLRRGGDLTVIAAGAGVAMAIQAAEALDSAGIEVDLIDIRSLAPLDMPTVEQSVAKTGRVFIVDNAGAMGGWGAELAARISANAFAHLDAPVVRQSGTHLACNNPPSPEVLAEAMRNLIALSAL